MHEYLIVSFAACADEGGAGERGGAVGHHRRLEVVESDEEGVGEAACAEEGLRHAWSRLRQRRTLVDGQEDPIRP